MLVSCLPRRVPRALFGLRGRSAAQGAQPAPTLGLGAVDLHVTDLSSRQFPTTVTLSPLTRGPSTAEDAGRLGSSFRSLAVWPWVSGRMASGLSPYGVTSFVHARLGCRGNQGISPVSDPNLLPVYHWCPGVTCSEWRLSMGTSISPHRPALIHSAILSPGPVSSGVTG